MTNPYLQKISDIENAVADAIKLLRKAANLYDAAIALRDSEDGAEHLSQFRGTDTIAAAAGVTSDSEREAQLIENIEACTKVMLDPKASVEKKLQAGTSMKSYKGHLTRLQNKNKKSLSFQKGTKWTNRSK